MLSPNQYKVILILFLLAVIEGCSQNVFKEISVQVDKKYRNGKQANKPTFHDIRMKVLNSSKPPFFKAGIDTLFMLEEYSVEDATYYGKIWDRRSSVKYRYQNGKLNYEITGPFSSYTCSLVQNWDTSAIRHEESLYSDLLPSSLIYGTRITKENGYIYIIDTIIFKKFFKVGRDDN